MKSLDKRSFTTIEAAVYCGVSGSYLRQARMPSKDLDAPNPTYLTPRKIVYLREDLDAWLDSKKSNAETAA